METTVTTTDGMKQGNGNDSDNYRQNETGARTVSDNYRRNGTGAGNDTDGENYRRNGIVAGRGSDNTSGMTLTARTTSGME